MNGIGFCGCSYTEGVPYIQEEQMYSNLVRNYFKPLHFFNYAKGGSSNREIFLQALELKSDTQVEHIFVQWSHSGRQRWKPAFDRLVTTTSRSYQNPVSDVLSISQNRFVTFIDVFRMIDNSYNQLVELGKQLHVLNNISNKLNKNIYYINGGMHIDPLFLNNKQIHDFSKELLPKSLDMLNFDVLPDSDINAGITEIRNSLSEIDINQWVDIDRIERVDRGNDGEHPGPESNTILANKIINFLEEKTND